MKRLLITAIVLLTSACFSQTIEEKGVKVGLGIAKFRGSDVKNAKSKIGGVFGAFLSYRLKEQIAIQPELLFAMKGAKGEEKISATETVKWTESLNYIEIPVLVKFSIPTQQNIKPSIFAGPSLGILLSAKSKNGAEKDIKDERKGTDIGLVIGGEIDFPIQTYRLKVDLRYTLGLTKIAKKEGDIKNGVISIMAGCAF